MGVIEEQSLEPAASSGPLLQTDQAGYSPSGTPGPARALEEKTRHYAYSQHQKEGRMVG